MLARVTAVTPEYPFGSGDPLEVARLVRRALAAAGRKAVDVTALIVVTDEPIATEALGRFARRALGPHGAGVRSSGEVIASTLGHEDRLAVAEEVDAVAGSCVIAVVLGPAAIATACCIG